MGLKKKYKRAFLFLATVIAVPMAIAIFIKAIPEPPLEELKKARITIAKCQTAKAEKYAPEFMKKATVMYDSAYTNWQRENDKFILFRNYDPVKKWSVLSEINAQEALRTSTRNYKNLESELQYKIENLDEDILRINNLYKKLPLSASVQTKYTKGIMLLSEAKLNYKNKSYLICKEKVTQAEKNIDYTHNTINNLLQDYFSEYPSWQRVVKNTIEWSRNNKDEVIIVDKFARKCFVYSSGREILNFDVELGKNWIGEKKHQGDYATPEGHYKIIQKKNRATTKYYKALMLNYPNNDDKIRYTEYKRKGLIPSNKKIGGLIEIHGDGGRGIDWTEGCVALKNEDIDKLFSKISVGTPVIIVGSLKPLSSFLN